MHGYIIVLLCNQNIQAYVFEELKRILMKLFRLFTLAGLLFTVGSVSAQNIIINNAPTATQLVQNTLIGPGLVTYNITFSGNNDQLGFFLENGSGLGLDSGLVMSSGNVTTITPPGTPSFDYGGPGDADVLLTAQSVTSNPAAGNINSTFDAAVLEFDFVPTGDVVVFNFVFASEEYLTWVNSQYNDAFGFYITGPNPLGPNYANTNLALVPGSTEPITISTIHPGLNAGYYVDNPGSTGISFNGYTVPIEIRFDVICDSTYHFKFAVADCMDGILDTGVFLDGGSFQAVPVDLTLETNIGDPLLGDTVIVEGCGVTADFIFTRPSCQSSDSLWVELSIAGTATNGADYATLPDSVLFLPDSTEVSIPFTAIQDFIFEGYEQVIVTVTNVLPSGDTIITTGVVWLFDAPNINSVANDTAIFCIQDSTLVTGYAEDGIPPYTYVWDTGSTTTSTYVPATANGTYEYYFTVIDACGFQDTDTLDFVVNQTLSIDSTVSFPSSACNPTGAVAAYVSGTTGIPLYNWSGPGAGSPNSIDATVWQNISPGWYYFSVTDNVCEAYDSAYVDILNPPMASFNAAPSYGCAPLDVVFVNTSQNTVNYEWTFGPGNVVNTASTQPIMQTFLSTTTVMLVAFDASNCTDTAYVSITVDPCGCTDPTALNYNPIATIEDGSCIYPSPEVIAPNVFTPNSDGDNDLYELDHIHAVEIELIIVNRWGNIMYESTGPNPVWDGKVGAVLADEGTYFYKYTATGAGGDQIEGHGFFHLIKD